MIAKEQLVGAIRGLPAGSPRLRVVSALTRMPQRRLAKALKVSQSTVSLIVMGQREASPAEQAIIAKAFGLDVADLFGERPIEVTQ